jgi:uncharacterized metal-binding protein
MVQRPYPTCDKCGKLVCVAFGLRVGEKINLEEAPPFCPMKLHPEVIERAIGEYDKEDVRELARVGSLQEAECYELKPDGLRATKPRVEETMGFAEKMGYRKLGIAMCLGLQNEARIMSSILERRGFEVACVGCKLGAVPKERIGLKPEEKIMPAELYEPMCNPITQAEVLNAEGVDFVILMGMCVGHDTLFIKYCRAPMTVLSTKDRVTGHNPLAALYTSKSYYGHL